MVCAQFCRAELYYYRDERGVLHITNIPMGKPWRNWSRYSPRTRYNPRREGRPREEYFQRAARLYALDPALLKAIAKAESNFDPRAVSSKGALGLMQLMPATAKAYGVRNPFDPEENVLGAAAFLRELFDEFRDIRLVLAAYNAGPEKVRVYRGVPPYAETRTYIERVLRFWKYYRRLKSYKILSKNP